MIYLRVLLENTTRCGELLCRHGLSVYVRTPGHKLLFDVGPDDTFARNAETLGLDLTEVDTLVLSHGHHDHGGGLEPFFLRNSQAPVYLQPAALEEYYSQAKSPVARYIGLEPPVRDYLHRMRFVEDMEAVDPELTLFTAQWSQTLPRANGKLRRLQEGQYIQDDFRHELNLLITAGGKSLLLAGCAHNGIVPIMERCCQILGRAPDAALGGFHLFSPGSGETEPEETILEIGRCLARWPTVYYTGHCTGQLAFDQLKGLLGDRLHSIHSGLELRL